MNVSNYALISKFSQRHPDSAAALKTWYELVAKAVWRNLVEVRQVYPHADLYKDCTVFNIGGNKYRLIAEISYPLQAVTINYILTHAEYDKDKWKKDC